jgi:hypothetical protein
MLNKLIPPAIASLACVLSSSALADFQFTFDGHTYEVITSGLTWTDASTAAQNRAIDGEAGNLARIDSEEENDEIFSQLSNNIDPSDFGNTSAPDGGGASYVWIGANDIQTEGEWIWVDNGAQFWQGDNTGSAVDGLYNNWGDEPDDFNGQDAAGIALNDWPLGVASQWNDVDTDNALYYIIEYATATAEFAIDAGLNGNWWNGLDRNGEGVQVEVSDGGDGSLIFVATIYSYDTVGNQIFLIAVGTVNGDTVEVEVFITDGGLWGEDFDPALVNETPWGTGTFTASSCDSMHMSLMPNAQFQGLGYTDLAYELVRLTTPALPCPLANPN